MANAALYFGADAACSSSVTSSTLSTAGIRRGYGTIVSRRARSGRSSVTVKKKRRAETALLMLHAALCLMQLEQAQVFRGRRVRRPADEGRECSHLSHIVAARVLFEAAHGHVFDHARSQWADGPLGGTGGHRGFLSRAEGCWTFDARDRTPRSSRATAHHLVENALTTTRSPPARAGSFIP